MSRTIDITARGMAKNGGGSGEVSDIKVDGKSIVKNGQANLATESPYDPETNPLATMNDVGGGSVDSLIEETTWSQLKAKRDAGELTPGMKYRITDYVTIINSALAPTYTSAEFPFDIIVTATSESTLSEDAKAMLNDNDTTHFRNTETVVISAHWPDPMPKPEDIQFLYKGSSSEVDNYEEEEGDSDTIIISLGTKEDRKGNLVPAMFNPAPDGDTTHDTWYIYSGTVTIDNEVYDLWEEWCEGEGGWQSETYFHATNRIVVAETEEHVFPVANLEAWKIKYCLDNDITRFNWAANGPSTATKVYLDATDQYAVFVRYPSEDTNNLKAFVMINDSIGKEISEITDWTDIVDYSAVDRYGIAFWETDSDLPEDGYWMNIDGTESIEYGFSGVEEHYNTGKGVIYFLEDEYHNSVPYDFKNIIFYDSKKDVRNYFTFAQGYSTQDGSLTGAFYNNIIGSNFDSSQQADGVEKCFKLPFVHFMLTNTSACWCCNNHIGSNSNVVLSAPNEISNNMVGNNCSEIILSTANWGLPLNNILVGNSCTGITVRSSENTIGVGCSNILIDRQSVGNVVGQYCSQVNIYNNSNYNTIGNSGERIYIYSSASYNHIGDSAENITLNIGCSSNELDDDCGGITFGYNCSINKIGPSCAAVTLNNGISCTEIGANALNITLGEGSSRCRFGVGCQNINLPNNCYEICFDSGCQHINFTGMSQGGVNYPATPYCQSITFEGQCRQLEIHTQYNDDYSYLKAVVFHNINSEKKEFFSPERGLTNQVDYYYENDQIVKVSSHDSGSIISKITYEDSQVNPGEHQTWVFPKGILPVVYYRTKYDSNWYFDYENMEVNAYDDDQVTFAGKVADIEIIDNQIRIIDPAQYLDMLITDADSDDHIEAMVMDNFDATYHPRFNTHDMCHPSSGSGGGASFDILNQITYSYDYVEESGERYINHSHLTFPKNVLPLKIIGGNTAIYFDYSNHKLLSSFGSTYDKDNTYEIGTIEISNGVVVIHYLNNENNGDYGGGSAELTKNDMRVEYILFDGNYEPTMNTYIMLGVSNTGSNIAPRIYNTGAGKLTLRIDAPCGLLITYIRFNYKQDNVSKYCVIKFDESTDNYTVVSDTGSLTTVCNQNSSEAGDSVSRIFYQASGSTAISFVAGEVEMLRWVHYCHSATW